MPEFLQKKRGLRTGPGGRKSPDDPLKDPKATIEKDLKELSFVGGEDDPAPTRPEQQRDVSAKTTGISKSGRADGQQAEAGQVFVSYAWGGESEKIVDKLDRAFAGHAIQIVRDKKSLGYRGSIDAFERRIGQGKCIVLVISNKYLRSKHCMHELVQADANKNLRDRIFPIVLRDAKIYEAIDRLAYIRHWDTKIKKLDRAIKDTETVANLAGITDELDRYVRIRASFAHLVDLLGDMNALTPEMHEEDDFSLLIEAVEARLGKVPPADHPSARARDLSLEKMIEIFGRHFVKVEECDAVARALRSLEGRLSFPPRYTFRKGPYTTRIREITGKVVAFRGICDKFNPKMEQEKEAIDGLLSGLLRDLKKHGATLG